MKHWRGCAILAVVCVVLCASAAFGYGVGIYDDDHAAFGYSDYWATSPGSNYYGGSLHFAVNTGTWVIFSSATGTEFRLIYFQYPDNYLVKVEGRPSAGGDWTTIKNCDENGTTAYQVPCDWSTPYGTYDFRFTCMSGSAYCTIDAFSILSDFNPGPTPAPVVGSISLDHIGFVESEVTPIVASSLAVGMLFCFAMLASAKSRTTMLLAFLCIELFSAPIWIVNVALWAAIQSLWLFFYVVIEAFQRLVK